MRRRRVVRRGSGEREREEWGGRRDLNPRQPDPQSGALTKLSYDHQYGLKPMVQRESSQVWPDALDGLTGSPVGQLGRR